MIFDGRKFATDIESAVLEEVSMMGRRPKMVSYLVGEDKASESYVNMKRRAAERVGIIYEVKKYGKDLSIENLIADIETEGKRKDNDGIMVQLPLPENIRSRTDEVLSAIPLYMDVDGLRWRESGIMPATVKAVMSIIKDIDMNRSLLNIGDVWGRKFVVIGYTGNVGEPLVHFLKDKGVEVEGINTRTENPKNMLRDAGMVISCTGIPGLFGTDDIREDSIVIDVGIEKVEGKIVGDFDERVYEKVKLAVPVPGGVGPVTVISLLSNLVEMAGEF